MTTTLKDPNNILMTQGGYDALLEELKTLIEVDRPAVVQAIQDARAMGDLSENGMYTAAREKQAFLEGRIREVEDLIKRAEIAAKTTRDEVSLGSHVKVQSDKDVLEYYVVSPEEVDFKTNKISHESPLGQALMGKKLNQEFNVTAPVGIKKYKIIEIK